MQKQKFIAMADAVEAVRRSPTLESLDAHTSRLFRELGFDIYIHYRFACPQTGTAATYRTNCTTDFFTRYTREDYFSHDFVGHYARGATRPFMWDDTPDLELMTPRQRRVTDDIKSVGFQQGASVPLSGPAGCRMAFGLGNEMEPQAFRKLFVSVQSELLLAASIVHDHTLRLCGTVVRQQSPLTPREREVLGWTARGKTEADIADILMISPYTVAQHIASCRTKLNALNKTHATVMALEKGLL